MSSPTTIDSKSALPAFAVVCLVVVAVVGADALAQSGGDLGSADGTAAESGEAATEAPAPIRRRQIAPRERAPEAAVEALGTRIDRILDDRVSPEARVGIVAVDATTGEYLYTHNADETFNPASNMKLLTSAAALDRFGASHTFETEILATEREEGVVKEGLYVRGEGEAFLLFEDVIHWAAQLKVKGVERIEGGLIIDDTIFDRAYLPPAYGQKEEDASYRAPIGAVSINFNAVTAIASPGAEAGDKPSIRTFPPNDHVELDVRAETVSGTGRELTFKSEPTDDGATVVIVEGSIGVDAREMRSRLRIDNPPGYAGSILRKSLSMVGVDVEGPIRSGKTPPEAEVIVSHRSQPLSYIVLAMNKWSNNFMAEQLLRRLGADESKASTWPRSRKALRAFAKSVGIPPSQIHIKNGSGLYSGNEVAPRHFVRLLTHMLDHRAAPEYVSSLAVAGTDGTLADRMESPPLEGNLRAKTGTLNHVSALSGYLRTRSNRLVAFSMLFNETPRRAWRYRPVQDAVAEELAEFDE